MEARTNNTERAGRPEREQRPRNEPREPGEARRDRPGRSERIRQRNKNFREAAAPQKRTEKSTDSSRTPERPQKSLKRPPLAEKGGSRAVPDAPSPRTKPAERVGPDPELRIVLERALYRHVQSENPPIIAPDDTEWERREKRRRSVSDHAPSLEGDLSQEPSPRTAAAQSLAPRPTPPSIDPALIRQVVHFATLARCRNGVAEFQISFRREILAGAVLRIRALGNRRISLSLKGGELKVSEQELRDLITALERHGLDVVEVEVT